MTRVALVTAALVAAVALWGLSLPPRRANLAATWNDGTVRGLLHVHTQVSDGRGTRDEIAAAAARAGLQFVVVTDHGDGTRKPISPAYLSGILILDGVEISTRGGHYMAIGLPQAPYVLGGEARDVVDDVRRLGGFGVAAHPDSPKEDLRWKDWTAPVDGFELINPDTSWRVHAFAGGGSSKWLLLRSLLAYPTRPAEAIAQLLTGTTALREKWMAVAGVRPLVAVAGADAHAKLALRETDPGDNTYSIPIPSYEASFSSLSVHVVPGQPFSGDADADAAALLAGLRAGRAYIAVDGWAAPSEFEFTAVAGSATARQGDTLPAGAPVTLRVRSNAPEGFSTVVWRGAQQLTERSEPAFELAVGGGPAVYSVEVRRPNAPELPAWATSNPIYVRAASADRPAETAAATAGQPLFDGLTGNGWSSEQDRTSLGVISVTKLVTGPRVLLRYGLSGGAVVGQYSAAAVDVANGVADSDAVAFSVKGEAPMRVSVQVRAEVPGSAPERWERSVLVDADERPRMVRFEDMTPVGSTHQPRPPKRDVRTILFVVDTTNTKPGASGRLWLGDVRLVNAR